MSEQTVDLIRKDVQQAKNEAKKNILLPVREVSDLLALVDSLQQQLGEKDRTIARLSADLDTSVSSQIDMTDKAYRYQKALEEAKTAIQKNLAFANGKDEQALLSAFNHINTALGE
ncbi:hypothetical protein ACU1JV_21975 [Paenibacillus sp. T2-29]